MTMVENRMVIGEYYRDPDSRDVILDCAEDEDYENYVFCNDEEVHALSAHYGVKLEAREAFDLWDDLKESRRAAICKAWVKRHCLDSFVDWQRALNHEEEEAWNERF